MLLHHSMTNCGQTSRSARLLTPNTPALPWYIPGLDLVLGELVCWLGHRVDGREFFRLLTDSVQAANAHGLESCSFSFQGLRIMVTPDPFVPRCWAIIIETDQGPRPFDMRVRLAAREVTEAQFEDQSEALRSLALIDGVTPSAFTSLPHIFRENAWRFATRLRSPVTGAISDWRGTLDRIIDKANLSLAHGEEQPYCFLSPPDGQAPCAQLAVPIHGLGAGWSRELYLTLGLGVNPKTLRAGIVAPTIITPHMMWRNRAVLAHLRWLWPLTDGRIAA